MLSTILPSRSKASSLRAVAGSVRSTSTTSTSTASTVPDNDEIESLNSCLEILYEVFPNGDIEYFRKLLASTSQESRLYVVAEIQLKHRKDAPARKAGELEDWMRFRTAQYKQAVQATLCKEFRGLPKSTIRAVMAENNSSYPRSAETLSSIAQKSWRVSFSNFFRRSTNPRENDTIHTGCEELDAEIFALTLPKREVQIDADRAVAKSLNEQEYTAAKELLECQCCFGDFAWEEIAACKEGHFFCHPCVVRSVQEAIFGQSSSLVHGNVKCLASSADACKATIPADVLESLLPKDIHAALNDRIISENLDRSGLRLVQCPFCAYAESDDKPVYAIKPPATLMFSLLSSFGFLGLAVMSSSILLLKLLLLISLLVFSAFFLATFSSDFTNWLEQVVRGICLRRRGTRFRCGREECGRASCVVCGKEWGAFHKCWEREEDERRGFVEGRMVEAVKRTCPMCHVSFIKSDGCNKLTCPCGYVMCYICRADIRDQGYQHFCQHFRLVPGTSCNECERCDLYASENQEEVVQHAQQTAEDEWWSRNSSKGPLRPGERTPGPGRWRGKWGVRFEALVEWIVERVVETEAG